jgi:hypothetical protein
MCWDVVAEPLLLAEALAVPVAVFVAWLAARATGAAVVLAEPEAAGAAAAGSAAGLCVWGAGAAVAAGVVPAELSADAVAESAVAATEPTAELADWTAAEPTDCTAAAGVPSWGLAADGFRLAAWAWWADSSRAITIAAATNATSAARRATCRNVAWCKPAPLPVLAPCGHNGRRNRLRQLPALVRPKHACEENLACSAGRV